MPHATISSGSYSFIRYHIIHIFCLTNRRILDSHLAQGLAFISRRCHFHFPWR
ncbi:uncharacterized protein EI90DRAFT_3061245 [Cantharellus anzutake]|uniref:uncharacterized protein n=1 Tax=Cantharellus anzutake TaxID=1750568 RepID=UPI0019049E8A|nr:uncharacterized protein EI90DRAFT_3061245 [Cantharellus anzutake]KAF8330008.1 hypothetical protein EI90DRAFT_3061245 [Cantharellus anzutake]